jgi:hypothetical protein
MRPFWGRFLRHAVAVGVSLAIIGHLLGRAFLFVHKVYSGTAYNSENERVLWQTPLVMAVFGILLTAALDFLILFIRRPVHGPVSDRPPAESTTAKAL